MLYEIAFKNLWRRKSKALLLLVGIAVGVSAIVTLLTITSAMNEEINNKFDQIGSNMVVKPKSEGLTLSYGGETVGGSINTNRELSQDAIEKIKNIKNAENISVIAPKLLGSLKTDQGSLLAVGVEFDKEFWIKKWWHIQGEKPTKEKEVILGYQLAQDLNKQVGSTIVTNDEELIVAGILEEIGSEEDNVLYMNLPLLQNILGKENKLSFIELSALCYTCPIEEIVMQISQKLPDAEVSAVLETVEARKAIVDKFSIMARVVSLIVFVIGVVIIGITIMSSVNRRINELGIFRAIGYGRKHIITMLLIEIASISLLGGIIGYTTGILLAKFLAPIVAQMEVLIYWNWQLGLITIVLAIISGAGSSILPALRAIRQDPANALRANY